MPAYSADDSGMVPVDTTTAPPPSVFGAPPVETVWQRLLKQLSAPIRGMQPLYQTPTDKWNQQVQGAQKAATAEQTQWGTPVAQLAGQVAGAEIPFAGQIGRARGEAAAMNPFVAQQQAEARAKTAQSNAQWRTNQIAGQRQRDAIALQQALGPNATIEQLDAYWGVGHPGEKFPGVTAPAGDDMIARGAEEGGPDATSGEATRIPIQVQPKAVANNRLPARANLWNQEVAKFGGDEEKAQEEINKMLPPPGGTAEQNARWRALNTEHSNLLKRHANSPTANVDDKNALADVRYKLDIGPKPMTKWVEKEVTEETPGFFGGKTTRKVQTEEPLYDSDTQREMGAAQADAEKAARGATLTPKSTDQDSETLTDEQAQQYLELRRAGRTQEEALADVMGD